MFRPATAQVPPLVAERPERTGVSPSRHLEKPQTWTLASDGRDRPPHRRRTLLDNSCPPASLRELRRAVPGRPRSPLCLPPRRTTYIASSAGTSIRVL